MPHLFSFASREGEDAIQEMGGEDLPYKSPRRPSLLKNLGGLLRRHHEQRDAGAYPQTAPPEQPQLNDYFGTRRSSLPDNTAHRRAVPSLPRPQTFRRQESEKREKLLEVPPSPTERRAVSADRRRGLSASAARRPLSPKPVPIPRVSAPEIINPEQQTSIVSRDEQPNKDDASKPSRNVPTLSPLQIPDSAQGEIDVNEEDEEGEIDQNSLQEEYDQRWILNLSMHFRDKSNREKFFVTYAETPTRWRRITISLDYRNAPDGSLEADLSTLHYQRDKSFRIYEAIRESLPDIQYYNTVTNLKLETTAEDGQLHVHVREDANETIQYPSVSLFDHVHARKYAESELEFISHLSGFVYKVRAEGETVIKKEIPGPDTVDEFLYEVNALDSLLGCKHVVQLQGLITDESGSVVKGLLISYASQGALVDMLYDFRNSPELSWHRREKWAKQIVQGLSDIHEAGFVQGDFTLSNIVVDERDDAQIIDINRRGCPVGWEPPELGRLIDSGQRIGMCIGVKTDLFQLGMVLWALAEEVDEPERVERPLPPVVEGVPAYFRRMVETCLSERPQGRSSAKKLLRQIPPTAGLPPPPGRPSVDFVEDVKLSDHSVSTTHRSDKEYIDPDMAITLEDVSARHRRRGSPASDYISDQVEYLDPLNPDSNPASTSYRFESSGSWVVGLRGRSPVSSRRRKSSPFARTASSSATSLSRSPPSRSRPRCGSESSDDEGAEKPSALAPCSSRTDPDDFSPPLPDAPADEKVAQRDGDMVALPLHDKRLAAVQGEDFEPQSPLLHTDSGFDEHMVEEFDGATESAKTQAKPLLDGIMASQPPIASDADAQKHSTHSLKVVTEGLTYAPIVALGDTFTKLHTSEHNDSISDAAGAVGTQTATGKADDDIRQG